MSFLSSLFISTAQAQDAVPQDVAAASGHAFMQFVPFFLILGIFYFLLIRPQQKRMNEHQEMLKTLKKGDKIVTGGGVIGAVVKVDGDDHLVVEIADGVRIKVMRSTITGLATPPAAANDDAKAKKEKNEKKEK